MKKFVLPRKLFFPALLISGLVIGFGETYSPDAGAAIHHRPEASANAGSTLNTYAAKHVNTAPGASERPAGKAGPASLSKAERELLRRQNDLEKARTDYLKVQRLVAQEYLGREEGERARQRVLKASAALAKARSHLEYAHIPEFQPPRPASVADGLVAAHD